MSRAGKGVSGDVFLAFDKANKRCVVIKPCAGQLKDSNYLNNLSLLLREYMFQELAHKILDRQCTAPKPLGFIPWKNNPGDCSTVQYMMVSEFCSVIPGDCTPLSVAQALIEHNKRPLLSAKEWSGVIRKLIRASEKLNEADLYHVDLKPDNVMLQFTNNRVEPIIIDYGSATRQERRAKGPMFVSKLDHKKFHPHTAPELFLQPRPTKTCDLYGISFIVLQVSEVLGITELKKYISAFRDLKPEMRPLHREFAIDIDNHFEMKQRRQGFERSIQPMQHKKPAIMPDSRPAKMQQVVPKKETQCRRKEFEKHNRPMVMQHKDPTKMQNIRPVNTSPVTTAPVTPAPVTPAPINPAPFNTAQKEEKPRVKHPLASILQPQIEGTCSKNGFMLKSTEDLMKMSKKRKEQSLPAPPPKRIKPDPAKATQENPPELKNLIDKICSNSEKIAQERKSTVLIKPHEVPIKAKGKKALLRDKLAVKKSNMKVSKFCSPDTGNKLILKKRSAANPHEVPTKPKFCSSKTVNKNTSATCPVQDAQESKTKSETMSSDEQDRMPKDILEDDLKLSDDESVSSPQENKAKDLSDDEAASMLDRLIEDNEQSISSSNSESVIDDGKNTAPPSSSPPPKQAKAEKGKVKLLNKKERKSIDFHELRAQATNDYIKTLFTEEYRKRRCSQTSSQSVNPFNDEKGKDDYSQPAKVKQMETKTNDKKSKNKTRNQAIQQPVNAVIASDNAHPNIITGQQPTTTQMPGNRQFWNTNQMSSYSQHINQNTISGNSHQMNPNQMSGYNQHMNANQISRYSQQMNPYQMSGYSHQMNPNQMSGYSQQINPNQMYGYSQQINPNSMYGYNQQINPNPMYGYSQQINPNQTSGYSHLMSGFPNQMPRYQ